MEAINFVVQINVFVLSHLRDFRSRDIPVYTRSVCFHLFRPHSNSLGDMWIYRRPNIPQGRPEWSHTWCTSVSGSAELNCCKKRWRNWLEVAQFWQVNTLSIFTNVLFAQQKYHRQNAASTPCLANEPSIKWKHWLFTIYMAKSVGTRFGQIQQQQQQFY